MKGGGERSCCQGTESSNTKDMIASIQEKINRNEAIENLVVSLLMLKLCMQACSQNLLLRYVPEYSGRAACLWREWTGERQAYTHIPSCHYVQGDHEPGEEVPVWRKASTARCAPPGITTKEMTGPLQQEKDWDKRFFFQPSREPTESEQRLTLSLCLEERLLTAMENHLYLFNKEIGRWTSHWSSPCRSSGQAGNTGLGPKVPGAAQE